MQNQSNATISANHAIVAISIVSTCLVVGGYIFNYTLLSHFGIKASHFFQISDYIASSLDQISFIFLLISIVAIPLFRENISSFRLNFIAATVICAILTAFLFIYFFLGRLYFHLLSLPLIVILTVLIFKMPALRCVENVNITCVAVLSAILFLFMTYAGSKALIDTVENGRYPDRYKIVLKKGFEKYSDRAILLTNSKYVFLMDKASHKIAILPLTNIESIETK